MEQLIKKLLFVLATGFILIACSAPKYTYYFSKYSTKTKGIESVKYATNTFEYVDTPIEVQYSPSTSIKEEIQMTSISNESVVLSTNGSKSITHADYQPLTKSVNNIDTIKQQQKHKGKSLNNDDEKSGDESKNKFAVRGAIFSILGGIPVIGYPLAIVGVILSAKGLKSKKRWLAIIGLTIGIIILVVEPIIFWLSLGG